MLIENICFGGCDSYQDAAERDVERYERSFKMLPTAHKVYIIIFSVLVTTCFLYFYSTCSSF
jgi:hypothetical protein